MSKRSKPTTYKIGVSAGREHWIELSAYSANDLRTVFSLVLVVGNEVLIAASGIDNGAQALYCQPKALADVPEGKLLKYLSQLEKEAVATNCPPMRDRYGGVDVFERYFGVRSVEEVRRALDALG